MCFAHVFLVRYSLSKKTCNSGPKLNFLNKQTRWQCGFSLESNPWSLQLVQFAAPIDHQSLTLMMMKRRMAPPQRKMMEPVSSYPLWVVSFWHPVSLVFFSSQRSLCFFAFFWLLPAPKGWFPHGFEPNNQNWLPLGWKSLNLLGKNNGVVVNKYPHVKAAPLTSIKGSDLFLLVHKSKLGTQIKLRLGANKICCPIVKRTMVWIFCTPWPIASQGLLTVWGMFPT